MSPVPAMSALSAASSSQSSLVAATGWIEGILLGPVATSLAVIAVAWLGFAMLGGRLDVRRAAQLVLGAFILFGAPLIVRELVGLAREGGAQSAAPIELPQSPPPRAAPSTPPLVDPYAGAAVRGVE